VGGRAGLRRGELEAASRRAAGRLPLAGLSAGDRVLVSAATSMELVVDLRNVNMGLEGRSRPGTRYCDEHG
jgi:hypothetical protein